MLHLRSAQHRLSDAEFVAFQAALLEARRKAAEALARTSVYPHDDTGKSIDLGRVMLDPAGLALEFRRVVAVLREHAVADPEKLDGLVALVEGGALELDALVRAVFDKGPGFFSALGAQHPEADVPSVLVVAEALARPVFEVCAARLGCKERARTLKEPGCPVCGNEPRLAFTDPQSGERGVVCSLCGHDWRIPIVGCPFCGNEQQDKLRFFTVDEASACRVDVCDACKRYLKVVDQTKVSEQGEHRPWPLEDAAMVYLDLAAHKEGYR